MPGLRLLDKINREKVEILSFFYTISCLLNAVRIEFKTEKLRCNKKCNEKKFHLSTGSPTHASNALSSLLPMR